MHTDKYSSREEGGGKPLNGLPPSVVGVVLLQEEVIAMKPGNISVPLMFRVAEGMGHVRERISSFPSVVLFFPGRAAKLGFFFLAGVEDACQAVLTEGLGPLQKSPAVRSPNHKSFSNRLIYCGIHKSTTKL